MILNAIDKAYNDFVDKHYNYIYYCIDIHGTLIKSTYTEIAKEFYLGAIDFLKFLNTL